MKITVYHDDRGNIFAVAARSDDAPPAFMASRSPLRSTEVNEPGLTPDLEATEICKRLDDLKKGRRMEITTGGGRLVDRQA